MSYFYTVKSSLFLDLPTQFHDKQLTPDLMEIMRLLRTSPDPVNTILYNLSKARYHFYKKQKFELMLKECFALIASSSLQERDRNILERSALYLKITGGLFYGYPIPSMSQDARKMFQYTQLNNLYDTTGFFLLLFFLLIEGDVDSYTDYVKKHGPSMFVKGNENYISFLQALKYFLERKYTQAIMMLMDVSYSQSHYLAIWSRLLEIAIHAREGEWALCKVMINRAKRMVMNETFPHLLKRPVLIYLHASAQLSKGQQQVDLSATFAYYQRLLQNK
jgi:hypothetical protein